MSTLPDAAMKAAVEEKIDLLGDDYDFERRDSTTQIYAVNAEDVKMEIQPYNSTLERAMGGTENIDDYKAWIKAGADVLKDDRVAISGVYCLVTSLKDWGTHSVITLYQTGTASD